MHTQLVSTGRRHERRARFVDFRRSRSPDLRDRLVRRHLPLARRIARRFARRGVPFEDLYQVASIGLIQAVDRFDPARGVPFEAFAAPTIVGEIKHHFRDRTWELRVPRSVQERHRAVNAAVERLSSRLGRSPTIPELARAVGAAEEEIVEAIEAGVGHRTRRLDDSEAHRPGQAALSEVDPMFGRVDDRLEVEGLLAELEPRCRLIVQLYYVQGLSQDAIAARLGVSQMHVSRLLRRSLARLRERLEVDR